jgi:hypothetical protein
VASADEGFASAGCAHKFNRELIPSAPAVTDEVFRKSLRVKFTTSSLPDIQNSAYALCERNRVPQI